MKKILSIILSALMLSSMLALFAVPTAADGAATAPETNKELVMYVSDEGLDTNDGLTAEAPKQTINKAIDYMKTIVPGAEYTSGKIVLVGDVTIKSSTDESGHFNFPITITSADKSNARLLLKNNYRISGETLFTNIQVLLVTTTKRMGLIADGDKLTMGLPGVANDVVTYDPNVSKSPLNVSGGFVSWTTSSTVIDVTLNSGTYNVINTGAYAWAGIVDTNVNFVINKGVTVSNGVITLGGAMTSQTTIADDTGIKVGGDYNVIINGGTFTNTNIHIGVLNSGDAGLRECSVEGKTTLDINGGSFTNCKIATYETLGGIGEKDKSNGMSNMNFKNGITVDFTDIPDAEKSKYTAMVETSNIASTPTKNKITVVEHSLTKFENINDNQHKASCPCGCGLTEMQDHPYGEPIVTTQPSHSTEGENTYTCPICNGTKLETISPDATTHNYTTGWVKDDDNNHKKTCDDPACPDSNKGLVTEAHTWNKGEITKEATHLEEGEKTYTCSDCNGTKTEVVPKTNVHSMGDWEMHDDAQHKRVCACGEAKYADHDWDSGKVTKKATSDEEGEKLFTCFDCGATKTEAIEKLAPETEAESEGGCGSSVGFSVIAIAVISAAAAFVPKKKQH